jgi:hypothetical protein
MLEGPSSCGFSDSWEPLFRKDLVSEPLLGSVEAMEANSACRLSTWPLKSSSRPSQSGMLLVRFFNASIAISWDSAFVDDAVLVVVRHARCNNTQRTDRLVNVGDGVKGVFGGGVELGRTQQCLDQQRTNTIQLPVVSECSAGALALLSRKHRTDGNAVADGDCN